jgi:hypothetical protein
MDTPVFYPVSRIRVKGLKREADTLRLMPRLSASSYTSAPPYIFMAWGLIKHGDDFTIHAL